MRKLRLLTTCALALAASGLCSAAFASVDNPESPVTSVDGNFASCLFYTPGSDFAKAPTAADSLNLTVNVAYGNKSEKVSQIAILPKDIKKLGFAENTKKASYTFRVPKDEYELFLWGAKENYQGVLFYYIDNLKLNNDTTISINTADCNIVTSFENYLSNGEIARQDLYMTSTKTVIEEGNCHNGTQCFFGARHVKRDIHLNHTLYNIINQKYKETSAITDSSKDPTLWTNTKDMGFEFVEVYKYLTKDGICAIRYDINGTNMGRKLTNKDRGYKSIDLKLNLPPCDSIPKGFNPEEFNNNGFQFWYNGAMVNCTTGYQAVAATDSKTKYWIDATPNGTKKGYDFALHPGVVQTKLGTRSYGFNTLPVTPGDDGIRFLPIQYIYPGLIIWSGSDGSSFYINDFLNPRLNADANTVWGTGFTYASFYPALGNKPDTPKTEYCFKGMNGEQRCGDVLTHTLKVYTKDGDAWKELWSGTYDKISTLSTQLKNANYVGRVAIEVRDSAYYADNHRGLSTSRVEFDMNRPDVAPPVLTMINIRNGEDKITDRLKTSDEGVIELYASDLEYKMVSIKGFDLDFVKSVKVEYADHGSEKYSELPMKHNPDRDIELFWGQNFSASLKDMKSEKEGGWFDMRVTITDEDNNTYTLNAAPAFFVEKVSGVKSVGIEASDIVYYNGVIRVMGDDNAMIEVYDLAGRKVLEGDNSLETGSLAHSVYIVRVKGESGTANAKIVVK